MKNVLKHGLLLALISLLFIQCNKNDDEIDTRPYYISTGTYTANDDNAFNFIIDMDNGSTIVPKSVNWVSTGVENNSRVSVIYAEALVEETADGKVITADIDRIDDVLTKKVLQLTPDNTDSIGDNAIGITSDDIWHSEKHLNVLFNYYGGYYTHYINLVQPFEDKYDESGNLVLEFKHNANYDPGYAILQGIVSFDMEDLRPADSDSLHYVFKWKGYDQLVNSVEGVFVYGDEEEPVITQSFKVSEKAIVK